MTFITILWINKPPLLLNKNSIEMGAISWQVAISRIHRSKFGFVCVWQSQAHYVRSDL